MTVTSEVLAVLVTCNIAIMGANAKFMYSLWGDIKQIKADMVKLAVEQARTTREVEEKMDLSDCMKHCDHCSEQMKREMREKDKCIWDAFGRHGHIGLPEGSKVTR
jgi:hypothetical protein